MSPLQHLLFPNLSFTRNDMAPHHRLQSYYGYAFESWCTSDTLPHSQSQRQPGWGGDVDTNVQWCQVAKTKLGGVRLIVGGEVDCVRGVYLMHSQEDFAAHQSFETFQGHTKVALITSSN